MWAVLRRRKLVVSRLRDGDSLEDLRSAIAAWMNTHNHERSHQALGWLTPAEKRSNNLGCDKVAA